MSWRSTVHFYQQLRLLLRAGFPISDAVAQAGAHAAAPYRRWAPRLAAGCAAGQELHRQLAALGEKPLIVGLFAAGERSGHVDDACLEIESFYEHASRLRSLLIGRSLYPLLLLHAALVIPALVGVVAAAAPAWTLALGPALFWGAVAILALLTRLGLRSGALARIGLRAPARALVQPLVTANACLVLRAAHRSGMLWPQALELAAAACGNRAWARLLHQAGRGIERGEIPDLPTALAAAQLPTETVQLCASADRAGSLEEALGRAATLARERFQARSLWASRCAAGALYALAVLLAIVAIVRLFHQIYGPVFEELQAL